MENMLDFFCKEFKPENSRIPGFIDLDQFLLAEAADRIRVLINS